MDSRLADEVAKNVVNKKGLKLKRVRFPYDKVYEDMPYANQEVPLDLDLIPDKLSSI